MNLFLAGFSNFKPLSSVIGGVEDVVDGVGVADGVGGSVYQDETTAAAASTATAVLALAAATATTATTATTTTTTTTATTTATSTTAT